MTFLLGTLQAHHSQENDGSRQVVVGRVSMPEKRRDKQNKEMITVKLKTTEDPLQRYHKEKFVNTKGIKHRESTKDIAKKNNTCPPTSLITRVVYLSFFMSSIVGNRSPKTEST
uniref:Uncharacterized protein n=1 Tax=Vitis vinifera TaxID=29760 RepID=A5BYW9_VITVI|nr:hypothetical protein VITISV_007381 [Vitis vinifera]